MAWSYEARLRAIGRLADAAQLSSVCISEFEEGFLVLGMGITEQVGGVEPSERSLEYSFAEVDALCAEIEGE